MEKNGRTEAEQQSPADERRKNTANKRMARHKAETIDSENAHADEHADQKAVRNAGCIMSNRSRIKNDERGTCKRGEKRKNPQKRRTAFLFAAASVNALQRLFKISRHCAMRSFQALPQGELRRKDLQSSRNKTWF